MEIKNKLIINSGFIESFKRMGSITGLPASDKMKIVGLRKELTEALLELQEVAKDCDTATLDTLLDQTREFKSDKIDVSDALVNGLSADDIFNLEPILQGEL